ncbi:hypothetical protein Tco_0865557 [Tanacetum coccineum]
MKSAKICPFTDVLGMYYSPSSILHFCSLPAISGLDRTCLIGWSMMTMIGATNEVDCICFASYSVINTALTASRAAASFNFRSPLEITFLCAFLQGFEALEGVSAEGFHLLIYFWEWIAIFRACLVQVFEVHTHPPAVVMLLYHYRI